MFAKPLIASMALVAAAFTPSFAEVASGSPLSADGFVALPFAEESTDTQLTFLVARVTDPGTINPGEPMPGYPNTDVRYMADFIMQAIADGKKVVFRSSDGVDVSALLSNDQKVKGDGKIPILVRGGATLN